MLDTITLKVPQGLGDIFWVYQKFAPYVQAIHFEVPVSSLDPVQLRALDWCRLWPKVASVNPVLERYELAYPMRIEHALSAASAGMKVSYGANHALEAGVRLEYIDPGYPPEWGVKMADCDRVRRSDYLVLYISGHARHARHGNLWTVFDWVQLTLHLRRRFGKIMVHVIGAEYDREVAEAAYAALSEDTDTQLTINAPPDHVCRLLAGARLFLGFQSGLGIMADNLGTPQLMMYFNHLDGLRYAWCQPGHERTKYHAFCFNTPWQKVAEELGAKL